MTTAAAEPVAVPPPPPAADEVPVLQIRGADMQFGGLKAVSDFNLKLEQGELVGLIGPNGAGKTTCFNIITGVYKPTAGEIHFQGRRIDGTKPHEIVQGGIARTFQNIRLFKELSVLENVRVAHVPTSGYNLFDSIFRTPRYRQNEKRIREASIELLDKFKLSKRAMELAGSLPYGEQRRLEIVRALATGPKLLILDEPAAGMNPHETEDLMWLIRWIREKFDITILLIEHDMTLVMGICERIVVLDHGVTIARGLPNEIAANPEVIKAYLGEEALDDDDDEEPEGVRASETSSGDEPPAADSQPPAPDA